MISIDIHIIGNKLRKSTDNYGEHLFKLYRSNLLGLEEIIIYLCAIADSPKTDKRESGGNYAD